MDFNRFLNNEYLIATSLLFFIIYSSVISHELPKWVSSLFKNDIFRVLYLSLLLIVPFETSPYVALIIALVFVVTMNVLGKEEKKELFTKKIRGDIKKKNQFKINSKRNTKRNSKINTKINSKRNTGKRNAKTSQIRKRLSKTKF